MNNEGSKSAKHEIVRTSISSNKPKYLGLCVCACVCLLVRSVALSLKGIAAAGGGIHDLKVPTWRENYTAPLEGNDDNDNDQGDIDVDDNGDREDLKSRKGDYAGPKSLEGKIKVFYNLFTNDATQEERVQLIVDEQLSYLDPGVHILEITSIGHRLPSIANSTIREHYTNGSEALTLHALWDYCKKHNNSDTKVVYLHSKGSYHASQQNAVLRGFLTNGALSKECSNLPNKCNVCSSRMSPLPHPHTPGNMWLARCDYVATLLDPNSQAEGKLIINFNAGNPCKGWGRFFLEHWIHSHPSVMPCDLYPGKEYTWAYDNIPNANFSMDLQMAPRFDLDVYYRRICSPEGTTVGHRMWTYEKLYNITTLDDSWWGWKSLKRE